MKDDDGWVQVTYHTSKVIYEPLVKDLAMNQSKGISCVLTQTNEEAVTLVALMQRRGINCKLVQSMDGF